MSANGRGPRLCLRRRRHPCFIARSKARAKGRMERIGIIGGGAWGTALALTAARAGRRVVLWARESEVVDGINRGRENAAFLPGVPLVPEIRATSDLAEAARADGILLVSPAQHLRAIATALAPGLRPATPIVICAKGIEESSGALLTEVVAATLPGAPLALLSGPTF